MVQKIRVIDDDRNNQDLDEQEFRAHMLEYMQAIDWKLWEMLKIIQAQTGNTVDSDSENQTETEPHSVEKKPKKNKGIKPIIVDEGE